MEYLALPFTLRKGYLDKTDLYESISYSIGLLLSSRRGMMPFDPEYGCDIWDREFSDILTANKADLRANIRNSIDKYEKRLYNVSISIEGMESGPTRTLGIMVKVTANYKEDGEEKKYNEAFKIG